MSPLLVQQGAMCGDARPPRLGYPCITRVRRSTRELRVHGRLAPWRDRLAGRHCSPDIAPLTFSLACWTKLFHFPDPIWSPTRRRHFSAFPKLSFHQKCRSVFTSWPSEMFLNSWSCFYIVFFWRTCCIIWRFCNSSYRNIFKLTIEILFVSWTFTCSGPSHWKSFSNHHIRVRLTKSRKMTKLHTILWPNYYFSK